MSQEYKVCTNKGDGSDGTSRRIRRTRDRRRIQQMETIGKEDQSWSWVLL